MLLPVLLALSTACGRAGVPGPAAPDGTAPPVPPLGTGQPAPAPSAAWLPPPSELSRRSAAPDGPRMLRQGVDCELAPEPCRVEANGKVLVFSSWFDQTFPDWQPKWAARGPLGTAHAVYRFSPGAETPEPLVTCRWQRGDWETLPPRENLWLVLPDFPANRWRFVQPQTVDQAILSPSTLQAARDPLSGDYFIGLLCTGNYGWPLRSIRLGLPPPSDIVITGVGDTSLDLQESLLLSPEYTGGEPVEWEWCDSTGWPVWSGRSLACSRGITYGTEIPYLLRAWDSAGTETSYSFTLVHRDVSGDPPIILDITPTGGHSGLSQIIVPYGDWDALAATYFWDFGAAAEPSQHYGVWIEPVLGAPGTYPCHMSITTPTGTTVHNFDFQVVPQGAPLPPKVFEVRQPQAVSGQSGRFAAEDYFWSADTFLWDFGAAALTPQSAEHEPEVVFAAPGLHDCSVVFSNASGSSRYEFQLPVMHALPLTARLVQSDAFWWTKFEGRTGTFQASEQAAADGGRLDALAWDFGPGAEILQQAGDRVEVRFGRPGRHYAKLISTSDGQRRFHGFVYDVEGILPPDIKQLNTSYIPAESAGVYIQVSGSYNLLDRVEWHFGAACTPSDPVTTDTYVEIETGAAGTYPCSVTAWAGELSDTFEFELTLTPPLQ